MQRAALLLAVMVAGCAHVSVGRYVFNSSYQSNPIARGDVFVYEEGDSIPEHTVVASLNATGDQDIGDILDWTSPNDLRNALREEAGKLGANAIFWCGVEGPSFFSSSTVRLSAFAIYVPSLALAVFDNPMTHADTLVTLHGMPVQSLVGSQAFFLQLPNQRAPYLVKMLPEVVAYGGVIEAGATVSVTGMVYAMSDSVADAWVASGGIAASFFEASGVAVAGR